MSKALLRLGGSAQFKDRYTLNVDTNSIEFLIQIDFITTTMVDFHNLENLPIKDKKCVRA